MGHKPNDTLKLKLKPTEQQQKNKYKRNTTMGQEPNYTLKLKLKYDN